tara:strand:- start:270 stop:404 length:135 start_codon:yes stop_codon:yes gene_type:complete
MIELLKEILEFIGIFIVLGLFILGAIGSVYWLLLTWVFNNVDND